MPYILEPTFVCTLVGKYRDHRDSCPLAGKCIQHGRVCEYLEISVANPPRFRPPKIVVPPAPAVSSNDTTSNVAMRLRAGGAQ